MIIIKKDKKCDENIVCNMDIDKDELLNYYNEISEYNRYLYKKELEICIINMYESILKESLINSNEMKSIINSYYKNVRKYKNLIIELNEEFIIEMNIKNIEKYELDKDIIRYVLHILYNEEILSSESIEKWYNKLNEKDEYKNNKKLNDFMKWLMS